MILGNSLILSIEGAAIAASKSCTIDRSTDTIAVCSPTDGAPASYLPTTTGWSISTGGLIATKENAERLRSIWRRYQDGQQTLLRLRMTLDGDLVEEGEAILTSLQETGNLNELVKFSAQLQGSGPLLKSGLALTFAIAKNDTHIALSGHTMTLIDDDDDRVEYCEVSTTSKFRITMEDADNWFIMRGRHSDWEQTLDDMDGHGTMNEQAVARGTGGQTQLLPAGNYVIYACNYESRIDAHLHVSE